MPTVADLERLEALAGRLTPLGNAQRGELIRAEHWNMLVGAVLEVARAVLAEERAPATPPHDHADQVTLGWLDPRLRALIERGPLSDPAALNRVDDLDRRAAALATRLDTIQAEVRQVRNRIAEITTRDLVREQETSSIRRAVEGLADPRQEIVSLRESLRSIEQDVKVAVEVGSRLVVDGRPVDMQALEGRLRGVEELRDRLRTPEGDLLDATRLEQRLTQLTNTLVTEAELDEALRSRPPRIPEDQLGGLTEDLRASLRTDLETSQTRLADQIRGEVGTRMAGIDAQVARAVSDAIPAAQESILGTVRPEISAAVRQGVRSAQAAAGKLVDENATVLRTEFSQRLGDLQRDLGVTIQTEFARQLPVHIESLRAEIQLQAERTARIETRLTEHDQVLGRLGPRVERFDQDLLDAQVALRQEVLNEVDRRDAELVRRFEGRITLVEASVTDRVTTAIGDLRPQLLEETRAIASEAAITESRLVVNALRGELRGIAQEEVRSTRDQLRVDVTDEVARAFAGVPGLVANEVRRTTANLPELVRTEVETLKPTLRPMLDQVVAERLRPQ